MNIWSKEQTRDFVKIVKLCIAAHFVHRVHRLLQSLSSLKFLLDIKVDTYTTKLLSHCQSKCFRSFFFLLACRFFPFFSFQVVKVKEEEKPRSVSCISLLIWYPRLLSFLERNKWRQSGSYLLDNNLSLISLSLARLH